MAEYKYTTITHTILADTHTPIGIYLRLRDIYPQSILMECSDYHDKNDSRSFIGIHAIANVAISHGRVKMTLPDGKIIERLIDNTYTVAQAMNDFLALFNVENNNDGTCGLYGYTSFNAIKYLENIDIKDETRDRYDAPDILYTFYQDIIVLNHYHNTLTITTLQEENKEEKGEAHIVELLKIINKPVPHISYFKAIGPVSSTLEDDEHRQNIRRGIKHCLRGDVFQIVFSRRFVQRYEGDDFTLYRALRTINPSPYLFYFDFGGFHIFGSSPETHCRIEGNVAYIDPIAGTTKRTGNADIDKKAIEYLKQDPKENAEHVMLVDLARNDLSRNCHNVKVDFYKDIQLYSHVIHLVSRVSGILNTHSDPIKTFFDTFPAGTLSGAPKVKAMELISQYEPHNRGAYGGCIGYIGLDKSLNQAITIRTFVARNRELWFQAGGGIVAKSDVEYELQEVNNKLGALRRAITMAESLN